MAYNWELQLLDVDIPSPSSGHWSLSVFALVLAIKEVPGIFFFLVTQPVGFWGVPAGGHMQVKGTAHQGGHLLRGCRCVP